MKNIILCLSLCLITLPACKSFKRGFDNLNLFPVEQDLNLGKQVEAEIASKPSEFPLLPEQGNEEAYKYVRGIVSKILATGMVENKDRFPWKTQIIHDDKTLNAFCTPGGYMYVYTGLIRFLDTEDQLAGVMGHEIAHAANRHSTKQLTKILGIQIVIDAALGNKQAIKDIVGLLATVGALKFSRDHERQADTFSVKYLCGTHWNAAGAAGFFKKIEGKAQPPEWLSTHPNPGNRVKSIEDQKLISKCTGTATNKDAYDRIKSILPPAPNKPTTPPSGGNTTTPGGGTKSPGSGSGTGSGSGGKTPEKPKKPGE